MSDANRTQIGICEETTIGTTVGTPQFEILRITAAALAAQKELLSSKELKANRNIPDRTTVQISAAGDLPQEVSYGASDSLLRGAMCSEWIYAAVRDNHGTADSNITDVTTTDVTVIASNATQYRFATFAPGHLAYSTGFTAAGNNAVRRCGAGTTDTDLKLAGGTADAAPAAAARVKCIGFEGASGDITSTSTGLASTALDFTTLSLRVGMWLWVGGPTAGTAFATAGVAGWCRISVIAAAALTFDIKPSTWAVDAGTGKTVRAYFGDIINNGTTRRSYTVEQQFQDLAAPTYEYYRGMVPVQMEYSAAAKSILEVKTTFMGMTASLPATTRLAGVGTDIAAPTGDVFNATSNVGTILVNGAALTGNFVTQTTVSINNVGRRNEAVGSITSVNIRLGQFVATAKLSTYYDDPTILTIIRNSSAASYFLPFIDPNGTRALLFDMPRVKLGDGSPSVPGINTDRMLDTDIQAIEHPTLGYALSAQRLENYFV